MTPGEDTSLPKAPLAGAAQDTVVLKGNPQGHGDIDHLQVLRQVKLLLPAPLASLVNRAICTDAGFHHRF